jgi:hypothetical protein
MPEVQSRRLGHGEWPPALTRMFYARGNWPTLLRDGRLVAKPQRKPQTFLRRLFRPTAAAPILGPLLGGRQFIALARIAIRPLASGQRPASL